MTHDVKPSLRTFFCICFLLCSVFIHFFYCRDRICFFGSGSMHGVGEVMKFTTMRSCLEVINVP